MLINESHFTQKWSIVNLDEVVEFLDSQRKPITEKDRISGTYPYYGANGQQDLINDYIFDEPLVLLAEDGGHFGEPNRTIAYQINGKCWVNNHAHVLRPKNNINIRYLCRVLEHYDVSKYITGSTRAKLTKTSASQIKIPLPPIASQRRIANILDKADEIIRKRKEAIALTEQLQKSIFLDMFGDPVINPKGWEVVELGKLIIGKPNNGIFRKNDEYGGKIPVIWVKELFSGSILNTKNSISLDPTEQEIKKFGLKKGDILFCRSSLKLEGVGYNNVFDDEDDSALFECHIIRVSPNQSKINSIFLNYLLRTEGMRKVIISKSNTVTMSTIGQEQIKTIPVILPPKKNQDDFDKQLRYLIKLMAKKRFFLQESENLFNSLLQKAFKGEL
jgi:type I restriction enzyme S subunit